MHILPHAIPLSADEPRALHVKQFLDNPVRFSLTVKLDVSAAKLCPYPFYAVMLHAILQAANAPQCSNMRMTLQDGVPAIWSEVGANYTFFHAETKTFSSLFLPYCKGVAQFVAAYNHNRARYEHNSDYLPAPIPEYSIPISMIPWINFDSFDIALPATNYLAPVITMGKFCKDGERLHLPFSLSLHHAAGDGYHAAVFLQTLQDILCKIRIADPRSALSDRM